jgi:hypothetical protein
MEQIEGSETSAYKIQTPGNYPEESIQQTVNLLETFWLFLSQISSWRAGLCEFMEISDLPRHFHFRRLIRFCGRVQTFRSKRPQAHIVLINVLKSLKFNKKLIHFSLYEMCSKQIVLLRCLRQELIQ